MKRLVLVLLLATTPSMLFAQFWESHQLPAGVNDLSVFDHDEDGDPDVLGGGNIRIMTNQFPDDWIYTSYPLLPGNGGMADDMQWLDFDEDGDYDITYYGFDYDNVIGFHLGWIENLGDFEFEAHIIQEFDSGGPANWITAGDIEGDGDIDIVFTGAAPGSDAGLTSFVQQPGGQWTTIELWSQASYRPSGMADLDDDGFLDFAVFQLELPADTSTGGLTVYFGTDDGDFDPVHLRWASIGHEPDLIDFDHDGDLDIVSTHPQEDDGGLVPNEINWWENQGDRSFDGHLVDGWWHDFDGYRPIVALDVDNDGDTDIATVSRFNNVPELAIYYNQGNNTSFVRERIGNVDNIDQLIAADIDNDGDADLLSQHVYWFENPLLDPPQFIIRLVPRQTDIPGTGGQLIYDGMAYSQLDQTGTGTVWATVTGPAGTTELLWTRQLTFAPGQWYTYPDLTQFVPAWAPQGEYTFRIRAGIPGVGATPGDSLTFVKSPQAR